MLKNRMKKNVIAAALLLSGGFISAYASAQSYMGINVGRTSWNFKCDGATRCQQGAASWKLFGGRDISPYFAIEGGYVFMNEVGASDATLNANFTARGVDFAAIAKTPEWKGIVGYAKLGGAYMKGEVTASTMNLYGSEANYSGQGLFGVGLRYQIDPKLALRVELDRRNVRVSSIKDANYGVTNFTVGLQSEF